MYSNLRATRKKILHVSRWFLTINSNQTNRSIIKRFTDVYEAFFKNIHHFIIFLEPGEIVDIEDDPVIGIGKVQSRVHIHSLLTIRHHAKIHLDYDKIREFFGRLLKMTIHFNARAIHDSEVNIRKYLMKNYREFEEEEIKDLSND